MNISVKREIRAGSMSDTTEVTIDAPVATVDEAIVYAARLAAELAAEDEEIADIEIVPTQAGQDAAAAAYQRQALAVGSF